MKKSKYEELIKLFPEEISRREKILSMIFPMNKKNPGFKIIKKTK